MTDWSKIGIYTKCLVDAKKMRCYCLFEAMAIRGIRMQVMQMNDHDNYDFVVTEICYVLDKKPNAEWYLEDYTNNDYHILAFVLSGKSSYLLDGSTYHIKQGDLLFFPRGKIRSASSDKEHPWHFIYVVFKTSFGNATSERWFYEIPNVFPDSTKIQFATLFRELDHLWTGKKPGFLIKCRSIISEILYLMIREIHFSELNIPHSSKIEKIINLMEENYMESYSIEELAELADISPSYFRNLFKRVTGLTVTQYKNRIKISKARDLILSGKCNVTEAAKTVGFNNIYYFSRLFKKITCANPSDFIKR